LRIFSFRNLQVQSKGAAGGKLACNGDSSTHRFGDPLGKRQSEAGSMNLSGIDPRTAIKGIEDMVNLRGIDPNAKIND
jgi:hypothetical protein